MEDWLSVYTRSFLFVYVSILKVEMLLALKLLFISLNHIENTVLSALI